LRFLFASDRVSMSESFGIVYRAIAAFQIKKVRLTQKEAQCGAIALIQRFGGALNLNIHYHMLPLDFRTPSSPALADRALGAGRSEKERAAQGGRAGDSASYRHDVGAALKTSFSDRRDRVRTLRRSGEDHRVH